MCVEAANGYPSKYVNERLVVGARDEIEPAATARHTNVWRPPVAQSLRDFAEPGAGDRAKPPIDGVRNRGIGTPIRGQVKVVCEPCRVHYPSHLADELSADENRIDDRRCDIDAVELSRQALLGKTPANRSRENDVAVLDDPGPLRPIGSSSE